MSKVRKKTNKDHNTMKLVLYRGVGLGILEKAALPEGQISNMLP